MGRGWIAVGVVFFCLSFCLSTSVGAQENELDLLKKQIQELQERVKVLEAQQKVPPLQELKDRVQAVELQQQQPVEKLMTKAGDMLEIGGEVRVLYAKNEEADDTLQRTGLSTYLPTADYGRFTLDKLRLKINVKPTDKIEFKSKIDFEGEDNEIKVKSAYLQFKDLAPLVNKLSVGLEERFIEMERYTHTSPFARIAFWKYADAGLQYKGVFKSLYWHVSLTNGGILNDTEFGEDDATMNAIIRDDKGWTDYNENKQVGLGLGYKADLKQYGKADVLGFAYLSEIPNGLNRDNDAHDWGFLINDAHASVIGINPPRENFPGAPRNKESNKKFQCRAGGNIVYTNDPLELSSQWIYAQDGFLRRYVWFAQGTYTYDIDFGLLKAIQPLIRYEEYLVRWRHDYRAPLTWDRFRWTTALIGHFIKKDSVLLKLEYNFNNTRTGQGAEPRNDEFLAALWYKF